jgi:hypothetical protein
MAIAVYATMNGLPWRVDHDLTINNEIVIGHDRLPRRR